MLRTPQKRSARALFATAQQPHSRDIFLNQKIIPLDKLINQQEGILTYKVVTILTDRHELDHNQLINKNLSSNALNDTQSFINFIRYRAIKTWNCLPGDLRSASSLSSFRKKLKLMLHQQ